MAETETIKIWAQWGDSLPRLGETIPVSEWDAAKFKREGEEWTRTVGVPFSPLSWGHAYAREEKVPQGSWPQPALKLLELAWELTRSAERTSERHAAVDFASLDAMTALLAQIKAEAEGENPSTP
jgi:hypothetical protein